MKENQFRPILPIIIVFIVINGFALSGRSLLAKWNIDSSVLIVGNLVLFLVTCASYILFQRAIKSTNPQASIRAMYGSFMIKLFICAIAALVYILSFKNDVNKPALFLCMGFYLVYSFFEVSMLTKLTKKKKMPKREAPLRQLEQFLPPNTYDAVASYLEQYKVHLTVARERKSILGDYRHRTHHSNHRISVNGNLNRYAFLITLLHELAHLLAFEEFGNRILAHGKEWKKLYAHLLDQFLKNGIFPRAVEKELLVSLKNPAASSCAEDGLLRVLRQFDQSPSPHVLIEELPANSIFRTSDGRIFQRGIKLRKRFQCKELKTGKIYLFSPVYEVEGLKKIGDK